MKHTLCSAPLAAFALLLSAAEGDTFSGMWKIHSDIQGHQSDFDCTFTQTGKDLAGTCTSGERQLKITGKVEDKKLTFQYKTEYEGQELTVVHTGTMEAPPKLAGSVDVQPLGVSGEFTATQSR